MIGSLRGGVLAVAVVVAISVVPDVALAQVPGLPVAPDPFRTNATSGPDNEVRLRMGGSVFGDDSGIRWPWALVYRRRLADGVTLHAAGGTYRAPVLPDGHETRAQIGAAADVLLLRARLTLAGHGGVGYMDAADGRLLVFPVGIGGAVELMRAARLVGVPSPGGPPIYLWALPRVEIVDASVAGASQTDAVGALSFGLAVSASEGMGILLELDGRTGIADGAALSALPEWSAGVSVRYRF